MMTMKWVPGAMGLLVALNAGAAFAQTTTFSQIADCMGNATYTKLSIAQVQTLLTGTTACYPVSPPYQNQEFISGTTLSDYKKGSGDAVDPTSVIGSVAFNADNTVSYNYGTAAYTYSVWGASTSGPGNYDFCASTSAGITVKIVPGQAGCGGAP
jgi:hypothetical protein